MVLPLLLMLGSCAVADRAASHAGKTGSEQKITLPGPGLALSGVLFAPADAYAALAWLVRRADVDPERIFVAGWSHGGSAVMGVVRPEAPGRLANGPRFRAAIAFYPGCPRPPALNSYRPTMPLLILHGEADDWVPAAPCVDLALHFAHAPIVVRTILYPGAHHGFDAPSNRLVFLPDVYNPRAPCGRGAHAGGHEPSRAHAVQETRAYLSGFLTSPLPGPAR